jgi:putative transposase
VTARYAFIDAEKAQYSIVKMCAWMGVSTSGFYEWRDRPPSATAQRRARLATLIEWIFNDSDHTYGHRRVHAALARQGERVTAELVRAIMRELGLVPCQPRPFRPTTTIGGDPGPIPDLVARDFHADTPGTKLVGDITYLPTWQGWLYLATVIDCHTKACIGYAMAEHMRAELVIDALQMAARNYPLADDAIFHSDRGTQYTSQSFAEATAALGVLRSVGRTGSCFDNALAESFNASLKVERTHRTVYPTREHARAPVHRVPLQYETSPLGARLPNPARGSQRVPQSADRSVIKNHNSYPEFVGQTRSTGPWPTCLRGTSAPTLPGHCAPRSPTTCSTPPAPSPARATPSPAARPCADN